MNLDAYFSHSSQLRQKLLFLIREEQPPSLYDVRKLMLLDTIVIEPEESFEPETVGEA